MALTSSLCNGGNLLENIENFKPVRTCLHQGRKSEWILSAKQERGRKTEVEQIKSSTHDREREGGGRQSEVMKKRQLYDFPTQTFCTQLALKFCRFAKVTSRKPSVRSEEQQLQCSTSS